MEERSLSGPFFFVDFMRHSAHGDKKGRKHKEVENIKGPKGPPKLLTINH